MKEPILAINKYGSKFYRVDGQFHREDGPALEWSFGDKEWYRNGRLHREDGPAVECIDGNNDWYYEGKYIKCSSQEEFEKILKLKAFW